MCADTADPSAGAPSVDGTARRADPVIHSRLHLEDLDGIRSAAQWSLGAAGAVAVALLAGFSFSSLGPTAASSPLLAITVIFVTAVAVWLLAGLIRAAARVLVPDRGLIDDLVGIETENDAEQAGIEFDVARSTSTSSRLVRDVVDSVHQAAGCSLQTARP